MIVDETIANISAAVKAFAKNDPKLAEYLERDTSGEAPAFVGSWETDDSSADDGPRALAMQGLPWTPPVIGSPQWFLDEVRIAYGQQDTDYEVDELCGLKVIQREEITEPILVMGDGKWYSVVPEWARQAAQQAQGEDKARRERSDVFMPSEKKVLAPSEEIVTPSGA